MKTPLIVGVAGGSGSGKTTFARSLREALGEDNCGVVYQDSYYFDQSENFKGDGSINYDHPNAIDFSLLATHLDLLVQGEVVEIPFYSFKTHRREGPKNHFPPKPVIIVDGILILSQKLVRERLSFSVFIDTPEEVRFHRRLERDVRERGRTPGGVKAQFLKHVKPMHDQFVEPSKRHASQIISGEHSYALEIESLLSAFSEKTKNFLNLVL